MPSMQSADFEETSESVKSHIRCPGQLLPPVFFKLTVVSSKLFCPPLTSGLVQLQNFEDS